VKTYFSGLKNRLEISKRDPALSHVTSSGLPIEVSAENLGAKRGGSVAGSSPALTT